MKFSTSARLAPSILFLWTVLVGTNTVLQPVQAQEMIADVIAGSPDHGIFATALESTTGFEYLSNCNNDSSYKIVGGYTLMGWLNLTDNPNNPITVLAPVDDAFASLDVQKWLRPGYTKHLARILYAHFIPKREIMSSDMTSGWNLQSLTKDPTLKITSSNPVMINDATVVAADLMADNGVVHAIDAVFAPRWMDLTLFDSAKQLNELSTFALLVELAGLEESLLNENLGWTLFVPNNNAFAKLPAATVESLQLEENQNTLADILLYHALPSVLPSTKLWRDMGEERSSLTYTMANDKDVTIMATPKGTHIGTIGGANILKWDRLANNGIIHIIDEVLIP